MNLIIEKRESNTGSIHDIASDLDERIIVGRGNYAVVLASYYGGKGYTTHLTAGAAAQKSINTKQSHTIIDSTGSQLVVDGDGYLRHR